MRNQRNISFFPTLLGDLIKIKAAETVFAMPTGSSALSGFHPVTLTFGKHPGDFYLRLVDEASLEKADKIARGLEAVAAKPQDWTIPGHIPRPFEVINLKQNLN